MPVTAVTTEAEAGVTGTGVPELPELEPPVTLTTTNTTMTTMTTATAPQAMRAPDGPLGRAPGLPLTGRRPPLWPEPPRPAREGSPLPAALAVTGRLCWRLRSLAETEVLGLFPPGFGLLPPTGARLLSAIVP